MTKKRTPKKKLAAPVADRGEPEIAERPGAEAGSVAELNHVKSKVVRQDRHGYLPSLEAINDEFQEVDEEIDLPERQLAERVYAAYLERDDDLVRQAGVRGAVDRRNLVMEIAELRAEVVGLRTVHARNRVLHRRLNETLDEIRDATRENEKLREEIEEMTEKADPKLYARMRDEVAAAQERVEAEKKRREFAEGFLTNLQQMCRRLDPERRIYKGAIEEGTHGWMAEIERWVEAIVEAYQYEVEGHKSESQFEREMFEFLGTHCHELVMGLACWTVLDHTGDGDLRSTLNELRRAHEQRARDQAIEDRVRVGKVRLLGADDSPAL